MATTANIFVLIDALGWEWIKDHPFLKDIAPYRRPLESVLGYSTACIPSILTGCYPQEHGRVTLFRKASGRSPFQSLKWLCAMPPALVENRYVRHATKRMARAVNGFSGYFQLYGVPLRFLPMLEVSETRDIYKPGGIPEARSIFDELTDKGVDYGAYSYHQGSDRHLLERIKSDLRKGEKGFYFLYLAQIDAFLHEHANEPAAVASFISGYDTALREMYEVATSSYNKATIHVFSDHGMAPTVATLNVQARLAELPVRAGHDYFCLLDSTMARFWFSSDRAHTLITDALRKDCHGQWLSETNMRSFKAWFDDHRYGDEIYLMNEGNVIAPSYMGVTAPRGMHGFHPASKHSLASFISSEEYDVRHITDVFKVMKAHCA